MKPVLPRYRRLLPALILVAGVLGDCFADTLIMDNGDRLSGRITRVEKGKLGFDTSYAGEISIDIAKISSAVSDQQMTLSIDKTQHIHGTVSIEHGRVRLTREDGGAAIEMTADDDNVIAPGRLTGREWKYSGHVNIGGSDAKGNTVASRARVDAELVAQQEKVRVIAGTTINHASDHGKETESDGLVHAKYDRFITRKQYAYGNITLEHDQFKDIRLRTTIGAGRGYDIFASAQTNLSVEGGPSFVHTDFRSTPDENYPALRLALRFDHWLIARRLQLFQNTEVLIGLDGLRKSFAHAKTGLRMPLLDNFVASLEYDVDWDGNPVPGNVTTDRTFVFLLGYHW